MSASSISVGQVLGHYRLVEKIGSGGQGEVFRAHDERFDKDVALKILPSMVLADEPARKRFRREAQAVGKLSHPNIATAFYFGEENGIDFLVTEYVPGSGLDEQVAQGPMPEATVLALGIQLASGLQAAHHEGIVHRDLKPGNLRITQEGHLKILDFGLAELLDRTTDQASAETVTINMTLTGTLPYMAPEQFGGVCDQRTDLWAAGAVLYEMATGQLPFPETQVRQLKDAILHKDPVRPSAINPAVSAGLESVILRCLQKDPKKRYQSATELREDLLRVEQGRAVKAAERSRGKILALALVAVLLAASAVTVRYFWPEIRQKLWPTAEDTASQFRLMAILPLETASQSSSDDALVRGMAETVTARIAQGTNGQKLQVIPPSELIAQKVKTTDGARREFGVERVLEVSVQRSGDRVRVTCSLIDSQTHKLLNACSVTGDGADLFSLQDELAGRVIAMLPRDVQSEQPTPSEVHAAPPDGYEFYLKGRGYLLDYQKPENIDAAIKQFNLALKASPNYAPALAGLGEAYWHGYRDHGRGDGIDKAKSNCERALAADPRFAEGHTCLGNLYDATGKYQEAADEFRRALAVEHDNPDALNGLAESFDKMGNASGAEEIYKKAIALRPQYWAVYNWLGYFYFGQARYSDAASMFQKVIDIAPDNFYGYYNLGAMYLLEGHYDDAINALDRSIHLRPTAFAYSNLGAAYFYQHHFPEAINAFEKARSLDDQDYLNWGNLGDGLYWSQNRRLEAATAYKRAIELAQERLQVNPKDATARAYVAEYSAMLGDKHSATTELQAALELAPKNPDVMFRAALVYNQLGDQRQTLDWLKKAVAANFSRTTVRDTPDFEHLRSDQAFKSLVAGG